MDTGAQLGSGSVTQQPVGNGLRGLFGGVGNGGVTNALPPAFPGATAPQPNPLPDMPTPAPAPAPQPAKGPEWTMLDRPHGGGMNRDFDNPIWMRAGTDMGPLKPMPDWDMHLQRLGLGGGNGGYTNALPQAPKFPSRAALLAQAINDKYRG